MNHARLATDVAHVRLDRAELHIVRDALAAHEAASDDLGLHDEARATRALLGRVRDVLGALG